MNSATIVSAIATAEDFTQGPINSSKVRLFLVLVTRILLYFASAVSIPAPIVNVVPSAYANENDLFVSIKYWRTDASRAETFTFSTIDGTARAGVDYVATNGIAVFREGEKSAEIRVSIIDNGLVNRDRRYFGIEALFSTGYVEIVDNEVPATALNVDPLFLPDSDRLDWLWSFYDQRLWSLPDGRLLGWGGGMLLPNGSVDTDFASHPNGFEVLGVLDDGRIWSAFVDYANTAKLFRLLRPDGTVEAESPFKLQLNDTRATAVQKDGKLLIVFSEPDILSLKLLLVRLNLHGTLDSHFHSYRFENGDPLIAVQADGTILIRERVQESERLIRLQSDGSPDGTLSAATLPNEYSLLPRRNGKLIVSTDYGPLVQLNSDGSLDSSFAYDPVLQPVTPQVFENQEGMLFVADIQFNDVMLNGYQGLRGKRGAYLAKLTAAGLIEKKWEIITYSGFKYMNTSDGTVEPTVTFTQEGQILLTFGFTRVNQFFRPGFARFLTREPVQNFQVITPAESTPDGTVRIQIMRTGETLAPASVQFKTVDEGAVGGVDYVPQEGTLQFDPLVVRRDIYISLLRKPARGEQPKISIALSNPSSGYQAPSPVAVAIPGPLLLEELSADFDGNNQVRLRGTNPGTVYEIQYSTNLTSWQSAKTFNGGFDATDRAEWSTMTFGGLAPRLETHPPSFFYRAVAKEADLQRKSDDP